MSEQQGTAILRRAWHAIRCPHHGRFCPGRTCCCRDLHYRPLRFRRDMAAVENGSTSQEDQ